MITLGGKAKNSNIEVHDVQFIIAKDIAETYKVLKENWYGIDLKLHIDSYKEIKVVQGYSIEITDNITKDNNNDLYFVNIGGYNKNSMAEIHHYKFIVTNDFSSIKRSAIELYGKGLIEPHVDNILCITKSKLLRSIYEGEIKICKTNQKEDITPDWFGYKRLDTLKL